MSVEVQTSPPTLPLGGVVTRNQTCGAAERSVQQPKHQNETNQKPESNKTNDALKDTASLNMTSQPFDVAGRRHSSGGGHRGSNKRRYHGNRGNHHQFQHKRRRHSSKSQMILPTKFLLGGNISDPLNLNGLSESDEVKTPVSSPLPTPARYRDIVNVIIPPNITDPLNLVCSDDEANDEMFQNLANKQRKRHHKRKKDAPKDLALNTSKEAALGPLNIETDQTSMPAPRRAIQEKASPAIPKDKIVSPVIPQTSPRAWKRRRTTSEGPNVQPNVTTIRGILKTESSVKPDIEKSSDTTKPEVTSSAASATTTTAATVSPKPKYKRQHSGGQHQKHHKKEKKKDSKFIHGNYNRYYGYRNPNMDEDQRLKYFEKNWFEDKDVLDVGCNTGHVTLSIARDFDPNKIVGVDIDGYLIGIARKNIRHYLVAKDSETHKFPVSMATCYGPITAEKSEESVKDAAKKKFPGNVFFRQGDFTLESDDLLDLQKPEYDVILALSITKWIHLNHGDAGLKRTFKRFFRMLRPGGRLILEPQGWASYGKRKKLTDTIFKNYQSIRLRPDQFREFLTSRHVGFTAVRKLEIPFNKSQGFRRPIYVFTKANVQPESAKFESPIRVEPRPTPTRTLLDSLQGRYTPGMTPGTPGSFISGYSTPCGSMDSTAAKFEISAVRSGTASPCSVVSCSECKRRVIENGLTPNSRDSPSSSIDYCSQCSGARTPGSTLLDDYSNLPSVEAATPGRSSVNSPYSNDRNRYGSYNGPTPEPEIVSPEPDAVLSPEVSSPQPEVTSPEVNGIYSGTEESDVFLSAAEADNTEPTEINECCTENAEADSEPSVKDSPYTNASLSAPSTPGEESLR